MSCVSKVVQSTVEIIPNEVEIISSNLSHFLVQTCKKKKKKTINVMCSSLLHIYIYVYIYIYIYKICASCIFF
jgi:hypothetical protein